MHSSKTRPTNLFCECIFALPGDANLTLKLKLSQIYPLRTHHEHPSSNPIRAAERRPSPQGDASPRSTSWLTCRRLFNARRFCGSIGFGGLLMKETKVETRSKKFVQVSLSSEFAALVRSQAEAADRSSAAQLEHWAKLARAIETVIPAASVNELKSGTDAGEVLSRVGTFLLNQNTSSLKSRLAAARSPRFGVDESDPEIVIRFDPDGSQTRGAFDAGGNFIPAKAATERTTRNETRAETAVQPKRRATAGSRSAKGSSRAPIPA